MSPGLGESFGDVSGALILARKVGDIAGRAKSGRTEEGGTSVRGETRHNSTKFKYLYKTTKLHANFVGCLAIVG